MSAPKELSALCRLQARENSKYCTFAYVLNKDLQNDPEGSTVPRKPDNFYGLIFPLGSSNDLQKEEDYARKVIDITGHPRVTVAKFGCPVKLTLEPEQKTVVEVEYDKVEELQKKENLEDKRKYENRIKAEKELEKEIEEEGDVDNIEHFKRNAYLAVKHMSVYKQKLQEAEEALNNYQKRKEVLRDHYKRIPEHEEQWLPYLKNKLEGRGEQQLYQSVETGYNLIKEDLFMKPKKILKSKK